MSKIACYSKVKNTNTSVHSSLSSPKRSEGKVISFHSGEELIDHFKTSPNIDKTAIVRYLKNMSPFQKKRFPFWELSRPGEGTFLHWIAKHNHTDILPVLKGTEDAFSHRIYDMDDSERYSLYYAIKNNQFELVKFILDAKSDFGSLYIDEEEHTALSLAVEEGHTEMVRLFIERGHSLGIDKPGETDIVQFARSEFAKDPANKGKQDIVRYFDKLLTPSSEISSKSDDVSSRLKRKKELTTEDDLRPFYRTKEDPYHPLKKSLSNLKKIKI